MSFILTLVELWPGHTFLPRTNNLLKKKGEWVVITVYDTYLGKICPPEKFLYSDKQDLGTMAGTHWKDDLDTNLCQSI